VHIAYEYCDRANKYERLMMECYKRVLLYFRQKAEGLAKGVFADICLLFLDYTKICELN
jgi:hypothetical protein